MTLGAGTGPAGFMPAGLYDADEGLSAPAPSPLSRYIDPISRQYAMSDDGRALRQMPGSRQRVMLAIGTRLSSAADQLLGMQREEILGQRWTAEAELHARTALSRIVADGSIAILNVTPTKNTQTNRYTISVTYRDLTTGLEYEVGT